MTLSFFFHHGASNERIQHQTTIQRALWDRSWSGDARIVDEEANGWLSVVGGTSLLLAGERWHLLCAPLSRGEPTGDHIAAFLQLHTRLQALDASAAEARLTQELRSQLDDAVWLAWSPVERCVLAFRDRFGKIPLYVYQHNGTCILTNTRRALEPWMQNTAVRSVDALASMLVMGTPPTTRHTFFDHLERVPPHHRACIHLNKKTITYTPWWTWQESEIRPITIQNATATYQRLLAASVKGHLYGSDTVFELSGGLDSTGLLAAFRSENASHVVHGLHLGTSTHDRDHQLARLVADSMQVQLHRSSVAGHGDVVAPSPGTAGVLAEMGAIFQGFGERVDVVSGQGGDALFQLSRVDIDRMRSDLSPLAFMKCVRMHQHMHGKLPPFFLRERWVGRPKRFEQNGRNIPWLDATLNEAIWRFQRTLYDRASSHSGRSSLFLSPKWTAIFDMTDAGFHGQRVQYHFPYFDVPLLSFLSALPPVPFVYNKQLARLAWADHLPAAVVQRPKSLYQPVGTTRALRDYPVLSSRLTQDIPWLHMPTLRSVMTAPERYPHWVYPYVDATLQLLEWANGSSLERLML